MSRGAPTRAELMRVARALFAERGYAGVGTEEIVARANVTRGALYHHFADKKDLFRAVHEELEQELVASIGEQIAGIEDPWELVVTGVRAFLDACTDPALRQIALHRRPRGARLGGVARDRRPLRARPGQLRPAERDGRAGCSASRRSRRWRTS